MRARHYPFYLSGMRAYPREEEIDVIDCVPEDLLIMLCGLLREEVEEGTVEFQDELYGLSAPLAFMDGGEEGPAGVRDCSAH
jgi:hypothetical protein